MSERRFAIVAARFPLQPPTPPGEDYFAEPARMMTEAGWDVEILTSGVGDTAGNPMIRRFNSDAALVRHLALARYDLVHAHSHFRPALLAGILARRSVFTSHSYDLPRVAWKRRLLVALMNRFSRVVALSPYERDVYLTAGVDAAKVEVMALPINVKFFSQTGPPSDPPVILFVANLRPVKNPHVVVRAFQRVHKEISAARLVIAGENLMAQEFQTTGWLDANRLREALAVASVVVNSSRHEGFPLSIFEAAAASRPVCLPDIGSLRSLIGDNALYHAPSDDAGLAANILRYLREPELRRVHTVASRALVEHFDTPKVLARYRSLYESLLKS